MASAVDPEVFRALVEELAAQEARGTPEGIEVRALKRGRGKYKP